MIQELGTTSNSKFLSSMKLRCEMKCKLVQALAQIMHNALEDVIFDILSSSLVVFFSWYLEQFD